MKKDIATRWIKALRSGKYKQGNGTLCEVTNKSTKHCCLGVLTDMYQQECKRKKKKALTFKRIYDDGDGCIVAYGSTRETDVLPVAVKKWAGMRSRNGDLETDIYCGMDLVSMNDDGDSFKKIASVIEKKYEEL